jgi:hypothetical protein
MKDELTLFTGEIAIAKFLGACGKARHFHS